jgi:hypothetical protein
MNIVLFIATCIVGYVIFKMFNSDNYFNMKTNIQEYMSNRDDTKNENTQNKSNSTNKNVTRPSTNSNSLSTNGIAGQSAAYAANIKAQVIQLQDVLLISKYRSDYENSIMAVDDLVNLLMLEKALSINLSSPQQVLKELVELNGVKSALNNIMTYVDSSN